MVIYPAQSSFSAQNYEVQGGAAKILHKFVDVVLFQLRAAYCKRNPLASFGSQVLFINGCLSDATNLHLAAISALLLLCAVYTLRPAATLELVYTGPGAFKQYLF